MPVTISTAQEFHILTVCTGNICRSPLAEQYIRAGLAATGVTSASVSSAGTLAQPGQDMPPQAWALATSHGLQPGTHAARRISERDVREADVVLAMGREHRKEVAQLHPRAARRTFTLREFARLALGMTTDDLASAAALPLDDQAGRLRAAIAAVAARKGLVEAAADPLDDDVVDPYRRSDATYARSGRELVPAADVFIKILAVAATITDDSRRTS